MTIALFILFVIIACLLMFSGIKMTNKSYKINCMIYSCIFFVASIALLGTYIIDYKQARVVYAESLFLPKKNDPITMAAVQKQLTIEIEEINPIKDEVHLEAPLIRQLPELPRGCEIISLGMLLAFYDIHVEKKDLANDIRKNPAIFERKDNKTYFGNPNNGFVGDMYSLTTPGLGVYHKPIAELAEQYASDRTIYDFTGEDFSNIKEQLSLGRPVWVIINSHYKELPESEFITWHTEDGPIDITYREHSVLVTGYGEEFIYFNDPLDYRNSADIAEFEEAWIQMGRQAITIF